eukprot:738386-Pleurochrysis_carterae.AAC.1
MDLEPMRAMRDEAGSVDLFVGTAHEQMQHFMTMLDGIPLDETVAVICPNRHSDERMLNHVCAQYVNNWLRAHGLHDLSLWYDETRSKAHRSARTSPHQKARVVITTIHQSLGNEFDHVVVFGFHHNTNKRKPTKTDYYHFVKLHHVAKTRARKSLTLCCAPDMHMFYVSNDAFALLCVVGNGAPKRIRDITNTRYYKADDSKDEILPVPWGALHNDLPETTIVNLHNLYDITTAKAFAFGPLQPVQLPEWQELRTLYGIYAENIVYAAFGTPPEIKSLQKFCAGNTIVVDDGNSDEAKYVIKSLNLYEVRMHTRVSHLIDQQKKVERSLASAVQAGRSVDVARWRKILHLIESIVHSAGTMGYDTVQLHFDSYGRWCDMDVLRGWCRSECTPALLWNVCLFWWQYENQAGYRMSQNFEAHRRAIGQFEREWSAYGRSLCPHARTQ